MRILRTRKALERWRRQIRSQVGLVPTMGALHEGHLSLIKRARQQNKIVIASIFVNPTQFGPNEDYLRYPRPERRDLALLKAAECDAVFIPKSVREVYPLADETRILARRELSSILCGKFRPGHFDGVCQIVFRLFAWIKPTRAYFGEKDFQQLKVIEAMVEDLALPVKVVGCVTQRERSGLALSSRNQYLTSDQRGTAANIFRILSTAPTISVAKRLLKAQGVKVQYLEERWGRWLFAGFFHSVRLIDNVQRKSKRKGPWLSRRPLRRSSVNQAA